MISIETIHNLQDSDEFRLDMAQMLREEQAEERCHIEDDLRSQEVSCCLCGAQMKSRKNAACGRCLS